MTDTQIQASAGEGIEDATFDAVTAVVRANADAWKANDADAFADVYTEDATVVLPGRYIAGRENIRRFMAAAFAGPYAGTYCTDAAPEIRSLGAGAAVAVNETAILPNGTTEAPAESKRRATWVFTRSDDRWLVAAYHNAALA